MKLTLNKNDLLETTKRMEVGLNNRTIENKVTIMSYIRMDAKQVGLRLASSSMFVTVQCVVKAESTQGEATFCVPGDKFVGLIRSLEADTVTLMWEENSLIITSGTSRFTLHTAAACQFPALPDFTGISFEDIPSEMLFNLISRLAFAAATDDRRPHLKGIYFSSNEAACTDGYRLMLIEDLKLPINRPILVPAHELIKLLPFISEEETVGLACGLGELHLRIGNAIITLRLMDVTAYPGYRKVIPIHPYHEARVPKSTLIRALKRTMLITPDNSSVALSFAAPDKLTLSANSESGESVEEVPGIQTTTDLKICFGGKILLPVLERVNSEVVLFELRSAKDAVVIKEGSVTSVVMPRI